MLCVCENGHERTRGRTTTAVPPLACGDLVQCRCFELEKRKRWTAQRVSSEGGGNHGFVASGARRNPIRGSPVLFQRVRVTQTHPPHAASTTMNNLRILSTRASKVCLRMPLPASSLYFFSRIRPRLHTLALVSRLLITFLRTFCSMSRALCTAQTRHSPHSHPCLSRWGSV